MVLYCSWSSLGVVLALLENSRKACVLFEKVDRSVFMVLHQVRVYTGIIVGQDISGSRGTHLRPGRSS